MNPLIISDSPTSQIDDVLAKHLGISDLEEIEFKESKLNFLSTFKVLSLLGVGAFGVVLEVLNQYSQEVSALKVT